MKVDYPRHFWGRCKPSAVLGVQNVLNLARSDGSEEVTEGRKYVRHSHCAGQR